MSLRATFVVALLLVLALSAGLRLYHLGFPGEYVFDEVYYAKDAKVILQGKLGPQQPFLWEPGKEVSWPHPEMGKFAIAAGIALFGDRSFGWRIAAAAAGLLVLACVYPLARRLGLNRGWALVALILAAADSLLIAQSRIATLDIFVAAWSTLCVLLALRYVQTGHRLRWVALCGLAGGMALGTKWSGALALAAAAIVLVLARRRGWDAGAEGGGRGERLRGWLAAAAADVVWPLVFLVAVPLAIYMLSYTQYFAAGHTLGQWWELQRQMVQFNFNLQAEHSYASPAPSWILDARPVWYFFRDDGDYRGIVAMGNPFLWWTATVALLVSPVVALRYRERSLALAPLLIAALYFPWFAASRTSFLYYMTPVAPFLAILVATALMRLAGTDFEAPPDEAAPEEAPGRVSPRELARAARAPVALAAGAALFTIFAWYPLALLAEALFWTIPNALSYWAAIAVTAVGIAAAAIVVVVLLVVPRLRPAWRRLSWLCVGAMVGIAVVFLPIVIGLPISAEHYYRLIWFPSWI